MATALNGMPHFRPNVVFHASTTGALMTSMLLYDLTTPESPANADVPLDHPFELFMSKAIHGGAWRMAYEPDSYGKGAYAMGYLRPSPEDPTIVADEVHADEGTCTC